MLVLSGVFNTRILDATNYANQDHMRVNYTPIVVYTMLLVTGQPIKKTSNVFAWIWPNIAIADWSIIVQCHLLVTHVF
jgi:hypothetical protein